MGTSWSEEEKPKPLLPSPSAAPAVEAPNPLRQKRVLAEAKRCAALSLKRDGVCIDAASAGTDSPWTAYIQGPLGTVWEGGVFQVEISFPSRYPWQPLGLRFVHNIFHPNVAEDGAICNRLAGDHWSPALGPGAMLIYTRALLANPNFSARDLGEEGTEETTMAADREARRLGGLDTQPQKLYHYTRQAAAASIMDSWELKPSTTGAAGPGIYATTLHPTNCTKIEIASNNWGGASSGAKTDFVIELDVGRLQEQGYSVESVTDRDVWIIKRLLPGPPSIRLDDSNSVISDFHKMSTCCWNQSAGQLFRGDAEAYAAKVINTIEAFGQHMSSAERQRLSHESE